MALGHALEDVLEVGERLDVVELGGGDERANGGPAGGATVGSGEQMVLAAECDGSDGTFDRIVVEFDAPIIEELGQGAPTRQRIPHCVGNPAARRNAVKLG